MVEAKGLQRHSRHYNQPVCFFRMLRRCGIDKMRCSANDLRRDSSSFNLSFHRAIDDRTVDLTSGQFLLLSRSLIRFARVRTRSNRFRNVCSRSTRYEGRFVFFLPEARRSSFWCLYRDTLGLYVYVSASSTRRVLSVRERGGGGG